MKYVSIDFETANSSRLSACSIGVSVFEEDQLIRSNAYFIRPPKEFGMFNWYNIKIHGITKDMVADAPAFDSVWQMIREDIEGSVVLCHNAAFDIGVLKQMLEFYGQPLPHCKYACTVKISKRVWPDLENHRLDTVAQALHIGLNHHEAESDAMASGLILMKALHETTSKDIFDLADKIGIRLGALSPAGLQSCSTAEEIRKTDTGAVRKGREKCAAIK